MHTWITRAVAGRSCCPEAVAEWLCPKERNSLKRPQEVITRRSLAQEYLRSNECDHDNPESENRHRSNKDLSHEGRPYISEEHDRDDHARSDPGAPGKREEKRDVYEYEISHPLH